jgi:hypothetical protein
MVELNQFSFMKTSRKEEDTLIYKYYQEIYREEHYLFASEIAEKVGVYTKNGLLHTKFISFIYHCMYAFDRKLFYNTKKGLVEVFPFFPEQVEKIRNMVKAAPLDEKTGTYKVTILPMAGSSKTFYVNLNSIV